MLVVAKRIAENQTKEFIPIAQPELNGNEYQYLCDAFKSTWIGSTGDYINRFENEFSKYCDAKYGVSVSNGTAALHLALIALGIKAGDEVVVPDLTFPATINAVLYTGATPVIVDIEKDSWCIDPIKFKNVISKKTKAVILVHLYGQPCDMDALIQISRENNLKIVEDAAQAHGASYKGKRIGSFGDVSCFSFFGNKIITTGEGGMCVTNSSELSEKMRTFRDHGMSKQKRYWHDEIGYNYRLTNLQAAIGCGQLERIEFFINERRKIEEKYKLILKDLFDIKWPKDFPDRSRVTWIVSGCCETKKQLLKKLSENQIDSRPFFYPLSSMPIYEKYTFEPCRVSYEISRTGFSLPTFIGIDFEQIKSCFA